MADPRTRSVSTRERSMSVDIARSDDRVFAAMVNGHGGTWEVIADADAPRHVKLARGQDLAKGKIFSARWSEKNHSFVVPYGTPSEALDALGSVAYAYHRWLSEAEEWEAGSAEVLRRTYQHGETIGTTFDRTLRRPNPAKFETWDLWVFVPVKHSTAANWKKIKKAVGRAEVVGSGSDLRTGELDTSWFIKGEARAKAAAKRLRALRGLKLRVEIKPSRDAGILKKRAAKSAGRSSVARRHAPTGKRGIRFHHEGGTKFWKITPLPRQGRSFMVTWGKIGSRGQSQTKTFKSAVDARNAYERLIMQKLDRLYLRTIGTKINLGGGRLQYHF
jgi:predicted DNA-binding WGR domain protein